VIFANPLDQPVVRDSPGSHAWSRGLRAAPSPRTRPAHV
jgi:hypothetical protein